MTLDRTMAELAKRLAQATGEGEPCHLFGLPASAEAALALASASGGRFTVVVCDGPGTMEILHRDLLTLSAAAGTQDHVGRPLYYPPWETLPTPEDSRPGRTVSFPQDPDIAGYRMQALLALARTRGARDGPLLLATCIQALMQKTIPRRLLSRRTAVLPVGGEADPEQLARDLSDAGYVFESEVLEKPQASLRGGILDVWPPTETWPLRIEFFGSAIESIRAFSPVDQKSVGKLGECRIPPACEWSILHTLADRGECLLSYLPEDALIFWSREADVRDRAGIYEASVAECGAGDSLITFRGLQQRLARRAHVHVRTDPDAAPPEASTVPAMLPVRGVFEMPADVFQPDIGEGARRRLLQGLRSRASSQDAVLVFLDTPGALDHFRETLGKLAGETGAILAKEGVLSEGFVCDELGIVVIAESDLYGQRKMLDRRYQPEGERRGPPRYAGQRLAGPGDIEPGDLVVHVEHGIGKYLGLFEISVHDREQEVLTIEYADNARLHVPVSQAALLSRYVGTPSHKARLHRLGGKRWSKEKDAAEEAIADLAAGMLETQARRRLMSGHVFPSDTAWQHEFEATFPYRETADQHEVIRAVKDDMQSPRPMDRLICGDAGYGKTEVAMRAAFKAVMDQRQVAMLVPTTVLAQQHYETFARRMAPFPIRVEMLSRFRSAGRRSQILEGMADGTVDVVIGTHTLVQPEVRFKSLGLLIIDEEQRFGVKHKETLKQAQVTVDILTLTATPIPRTLHMSMTGARDMSLLQTPPRERMAIETIVSPNTDKVVREAILRELNREGQVFYLHNRVMTIERVRKRLERLVPEARVVVAHGQMAAGELAGVMHHFISGESDVLLCTTIIESGTDIPRVNTILIDRADRFGMADLYQLRGRVGRSNRKAYAYLMLPSHGAVDTAARKRINAIRRYSGLSAGFGLALRDLEIRGAGNMLGAQQSGHIAAIGFGLYCQMLRRTVAMLKGEDAPRLVDVDLRIDFIDLAPAPADASACAAIPYAYIEDERLRIAIYRRFAECSRTDEIDALRQELSDRFGPLPSAVGRLLTMVAIRVACADRNIQQAEVRAGKVMLTRNKDYLMVDRRFPRLAGTTADEKLDDTLRIVEQIG